jgi:hypothetical protein
MGALPSPALRRPLAEGEAKTRQGEAEAKQIRQSGRCSSVRDAAPQESDG